MKIPASSSILLATLAMSSSSSCLIAAAPTVGSGHADTDMMSSTSNHHVPSLHDVPDYPTELDMQERSETVAEKATSYPGRSDTRDGVVDSLVSVVRKIPLAGDTLSRILDSLLVSTRGPTGAKSMDVDGATPNIDPQDMQALQNAVGELSHALNSTGVAGSNDHGDNSDTPNPESSSATPENAATKGSLSAGSASSPPIPENPPNSPIDASLPVDV